MPTNPIPEPEDHILDKFSPHIATWFRDVFAHPTPVQTAAWSAISAGENALVVAPTGSGKTLAAFLWALNTLATAPGQTRLPVVNPTTKTSLQETLTAESDGNTTEKPRPHPTTSDMIETAGVPAHAPSSGATHSQIDTQTNTQTDAPAGVKILYISPLKALGTDVELNLRAPLTGINHTAARLGIHHPDITVAVRSGDTTAAERAAHIRNPPDILITTPESAYLMLTSKAATILSTVTTIIVDEIHAIAGTKRGVHLALTLERLEHLVEKPLQRIGLSATVRPHETIARFLGGRHPVTIIDPPATKTWDLSVVVPIPDMSDLPAPELGSTIGDYTIDDPLGLASPLVADAADDSEALDGSALGGSEMLGGSATLNAVVGPDAGMISDPPVVSGATSALGAATLDVPVASDTTTSIWPHIEQHLYATIMAHQSTLVFVNSRRIAEKLTAKLNELHAHACAYDRACAAGVRVQGGDDTDGADTWLARQAPPIPPAASRGRPPADMMKPSDEIVTAPRDIARAHHGSVAQEERARTETLLKEGLIKAVVATSSLELGIDMGAIDLVVQIESPPSVASGLQRVGRAGHIVGAASTGIFYPKHRADLVNTAVTVQRMRAGLIEEIRIPTNALDVLLQHTIAAVSVADWDVEQWFEIVTRAYPYHNLDREVFDAVINLASGSYPSTDFAELRPRIIYDRITGTLSARPGAQRIAVTSGGTIADRGMFGVFLLGGGEGARRVGELDEEMVYESRVGDVFTLGASSWRIEEITRDQVLVTPAPGSSGRLPFWLGDQVGRPAELGRAVGEFRRAVAQSLAVESAEGAGEKSNAESEHIFDGLDEWASDNIRRFISEQRDATGIVPDEKTLLVERFRDEVGDWRVVLHSPYGRGVNAAWALAVGAKISSDMGIDAQPVSGDDGIVLRLPESDVVPGASLFQIDPDDIADIVAEQVGNSALFAARFRECAARGLLLPRRNPGKRAPLWQQRQRAAQLLDVARKYPNFPIILEAVRECLQDVYDLPALVQLCEDIRGMRVRIAEVETMQPSPFAVAMLFTYTGAFIYETDSPLAEKRAAALALDPKLLAKLLGSVELRDLLDPDIIADVDARLRRIAPDRQARTREELIDALRILGPIPIADLPHHMLVDAFRIDDLDRQRVMRVRIAGVEHLAQVSDAPLLRDGLGIPVPPGVAAPTALVPDALEQLASRWCRTRGPFLLADMVAAFGLAPGVAHNLLSGLVDTGLIIVGHYRHGVDEPEYVAADVLKLIRSRSLAAARAQTQPVSHSAYARFLIDWHGISPIGTTGQPRHDSLDVGDEIYAVCEQLAGVRLPASAWETLILPSRVRDYNPADLQQLCHDGDIRIVGAGLAGTNDPWVLLLPAEYAADLVPVEVEPPTLSPAARSIYDMMSGSPGGGFLFDSLVDQVGDPAATRAALWELFDCGLVSPDSFAPLAARLAQGKTAHRTSRTPARSRLRAGRPGRPGRQGRMGRIGRGYAGVIHQTPPDMTGRWGLSPIPTADPTSRSVALGEAWLDRYGVVTRGAIQAENVLGGFALAYKVLSSFEESGKALRGHFITDLGAAQFATAAVIDRLRGFADTDDVTGWPSGTSEPNVCVIAACDPANPYGAALPWPGDGKSPSRAAGALVVLADGLPLAHLTRGGKTLTWFLQSRAEISEETIIRLVVQALSGAVGKNLTTRITIEKLNGKPVHESPHLEAFRTAGARLTPSGLRIGVPPVPRPQKRGRSVAEAIEQLGDGLSGSSGRGSTGRRRWR